MPKPEPFVKPRADHLDFDLLVRDRSGCRSMIGSQRRPRRRPGSGTARS